MGEISKADWLKRERSESIKNRLELLQSLLREVPTPSYVLDEDIIEKNMKIMAYVKEKTGCKILHALKAFSTYKVFPLMRRYLDGVCASGLNEAKLGYLEFGKEVHTFGAGYPERDIDGIARYSTAVIFNSFNQLKRYIERVRRRKKQVGIRVNPGYSEVETALYDPCAPNSRLGVTYEEFVSRYPEFRGKIDGIHFHAMCEQNSDVLKRILVKFEERFGEFIRDFNWVSFGGGHHITREDYDIDLLIDIVNDFKARYGVQIYLEPGEASVLDAGYYVTKVIDIVRNGMEIAIVDGSSEAHLPDVLLMPYRPVIYGSGKPFEKKYTYRIGGLSCLAGDVFGDYSFDEPLEENKKLIFLDMAHYTIVKNNTFNGIALPSIVLLNKGGSLEILKSFSYSDFKRRV